MKPVQLLSQAYYARKDVQQAIYDFCKNRETIPRYLEGFGSRPDALDYPSDLLNYAKKGATSFHCSEELWENPLAISTDMTPEQLNQIKIGWDFLIDIDSKYLDYSKIAARLIVQALEYHGIKNIGIKFSGSKGFHLIIPWRAFPKEINNIQTKDMFPEWPRIITKYIIERTKPKLIEEITKLSSSNKYIKDFTASEQVIPDLVLISPRHLFRMPYSLHEKTALASVVINKNKFPVLIFCPYYSCKTGILKFF